MILDNNFYVLGALLGGFIGFIFSGYMVLSASGRRKRDSLGGLQKMIGLFTLGIGISIAGIWIYFFPTQSPAFESQYIPRLVHVLTIGLSSLLLIAAGIALIRSWPGGSALLMAGNGFVVFTTILVLNSRGPSEYRVLVNGIAILLMLVSVYWVGLIYGWGHYVFHFDGTKLNQKKKTLDGKI